MENTVYLECYAGISGDMTVAALLDLGADETALREALASLPVEGFTVQIGRVRKAGLDACDFSVRLDAAHENRDHDMQYLHGGQERPSAGPEPDGGGHGEQERRGLAEILDIIRAGAMSPRARACAERIFTVLAEAEAKAHGILPEQVHFHEVGAVDSIVDVVAVAVCLDNLDITEVIVEKLYEGRGFVRCRHGVIPVPVPAVANIAAQYHLALHMTDTQGELVTPTGAAIVAAVRTRDALPETFHVEKIGVGAGKRAYDRPSLLRAMLITQQQAAPWASDVGGAGADTGSGTIPRPEADTGGGTIPRTWADAGNGIIPEADGRIYKLESNIDDCSGETLGYVMERLFAAGAKDVHYTPVFMKKNRPAYQLNVICAEARRARLEQIIFEETTTIGIRRFVLERTVLQRTVRELATSLGQARVKVCTLPDGQRRCYPEYDSAAALAGRHGISFAKACDIIRQEAQAADWNQNGDGTGDDKRSTQNVGT